MSRSSRDVGDTVMGVVGRGPRVGPSEVSDKPARPPRRLNTQLEACLSTTEHEHELLTDRNWTVAKTSILRSEVEEGKNNTFNRLGLGSENFMRDFFCSPQSMHRYRYASINKHFLGYALGKLGLAH